MTSDTRHSLSVRPFSRRDRQALRDLVFYNGRVHTHLDWLELDQWLDQPTIQVSLAWEGTRLSGAMGLSSPLGGARWVRLFALSDYSDGARITKALWINLLEAVRPAEREQIAILISSDWVSELLQQVGFSPIEQIVTLRRPHLSLPAITTPPGVILRVTRPEDVPRLTAIDHAAFIPPWQIDSWDVRRAEQSAALGLAAILSEQLVGYAICTVFVEGAHLARLGVLPAMQGRGIAAALLYEALLRFGRRGISTMTVNTQASNARSLHLYEGFGFARTGYDLPVYVARPAEAAHIMEG
jgi:ribosomal protein S18 acetylase RimI-like enzyme